MKTCTQCNQEKPLSSFTISKGKREEKCSACRWKNDKIRMAKKEQDKPAQDVFNRFISRAW